MQSVTRDDRSGRVWSPKQVQLDSTDDALLRARARGRFLSECLRVVLAVAVVSAMVVAAVQSACDCPESSDFSAPTLMEAQQPRSYPRTQVGKTLVAAGYCLPTLARPLLSKVETFLAVSRARLASVRLCQRRSWRCCTSTIQ